MDRQGRTWKNAEVGDRCGGTRDRLGRTGDPEGVGEDFGSAGNYAMEGLAWEKEDALAVRAGDIIEVLNPDARRVSVLDPKVGEVGFRDRVDLDDHSVVRVSLEESGHGLKPLGKCSRSDLRGGAEAEEETGDLPSLNNRLIVGDDSM